MVSTQIITPAVWTETARNLLLNPSYESASGTVEVRRNYALSPFGTATLPGYFAYPASSSANDGNVGGVPLTTSPVPPPVPGHPASANSLTIPAGAATGGGTVIATGLPAGDYVVTMLVNRRTGPTTQMQLAVRGVAGFGTARTFNFDEWTYIQESITITPAQAPAIIGWRSVNVVDPAATTFIVGNMQVAPVGQNVPQGALVLSGAKTDYDPDLVSAFTGAPEASPSTLTGARAAAVISPAATQALPAYQSSAPPRGGSKVARFVMLTAAAIAIPVGDVVPVNGSTYTLLLSVRANARPTTVRARISGASGGGDVVLVPGVWTEMRLTIPASSAGALSTGLFVAADPARVPGETIDIDCSLLSPGTYTGEYVDGDMYSTDRKRYRWLDAPNASISVEEVMTAAEVTAPVYEEVTLTSPDDEITFHALPEGGGFVYDNETLQRWYEPAESEPDVDGRPNANGAYGLGQVFTAEHKPLIVGQYYGTSSIDAKAQRQRLVAMRNEGNPVMMSVKDESGMVTRREVWVVDYAAPFAADFSHFTFDIDLIAPDPLRYGDETSDTDGMPTPGSGLVWNLGTAPSGLFFDWGTPGNAGEIQLTNSGGAASAPRIEVGGAGTIGGGFRVTEIETGRELTFARSLTLGDIVVLDSRTQRALLNGGDVTGLMTSRRWFSIPKGETRRYQITPLGAVSGAPTITGYVGAAWE